MIAGNHRSPRESGVHGRCHWGPGEEMSAGGSDVSRVYPRFGVYCPAQLIGDTVSDGGAMGPWGTGVDFSHSQQLSKLIELILAMKA